MPHKKSPISFEKWGFVSAFHLTLRLGVKKKTEERWQRRGIPGLFNLFQQSYFLSQRQKLFSRFA
jgi:hypothetical protein